MPYTTCHNHVYFSPLRINFFVIKVNLRNILICLVICSSLLTYFLFCYLFCNLSFILNVII